MDRERSGSGAARTLLEKVLWLLLVAAVLYVCFAVVPGLVTAGFYELVWATMDS